MLALRLMHGGSKRYYQLDHRFLFLFGYVFYLIVPYFLGRMDAFSEIPGVNLWQGFFQKIPEHNIIAYAVITATWLPAFYLGHLVFKMLRPQKRSLELYPANFTTRSVFFIACILFIVLILFAYASRGGLIAGASDRNVEQRGKLSTLLVVYNFFLAYQLVSKSKVSPILLAGFALNVLLLILSGSRLTALQGFLVLLFYKTSFAPKRWKARQIVLFMLIGFTVGAIVGITRINAEFSMERVAFSFMAEPFFTWFSAASFLSANDIPLLNFPTNFLTSFFNLVPNTFFSLGKYVVAVPQMGYPYENPFGADSIWTSLVINFGAVGSFFFVFAMGFLLNMLRHLSENNHFWTTYYFLICAMLPFEFFRTGFYILNKQVFFNFLVVPGILLLILKLTAYFQHRAISKAATGAGQQVG